MQAGRINNQPLRRTGDSSSKPTVPRNPLTQIIRKSIAFLLTRGSSKFRAKQIHAFAIRHGIPLSNPVLGKHLIYALVTVAAPISYVQNAFSQIKNPSIFTWNTLMRCYAESGSPGTAIALFRLMHSNFVQPDTHTFPFVLRSVALISDAIAGEMIHAVAITKGFAMLLFVQNSLVHMYAACGQCGSAYKVFVLLPERDVVAWNSMINGFSVNRKPYESLSLFKKMKLEGIEPDGFTMVGLLSACSELGSLGRMVHVYMVKVGLNKNVHAMNSLLDLYAKRGNTRNSLKDFHEMEEKNLVSWTSLIVGFAMNGLGKEALECFKEMQKMGFLPNEVTFIGVLSACSHCGKVDEGFMYFKCMVNDYGITPKIEHYGCMIDLLGRAGLVTQAYHYLQTMHLPPNAIVWRTLLAACKLHGHVALGELARARLLELEPGHCGDYVLLSNLYSSTHRWSGACDLRTRMLIEGVRKVRGHSRVEVRNCIHEFFTGYPIIHPQGDAIHAKLLEITRTMRLQGYVPCTENVLADIDEEEKEHSLVYHSEKIAIAFMLINTPPIATITVFNNTRVCSDCHLSIKFMSKAFDREIVVRDQSRFHHFINGSCSCNDYW